MDILRNETTKAGFESVGMKMMLRKCCENEKHEIPLCKIKGSDPSLTATLHEPLSVSDLK